MLDTTGELCLVRHGQTDWNQEGRYQGQLDTPLNETGIAQAKACADRLSNVYPPFEWIVSSDLQRACQTAKILAARLDIPLSLDLRLREIHLGSWQGRLHHEVKVGSYLQDGAGIIDPYQPHAPGGESVAQVAERARRCIDEFILRYPGKRIIVVAHGVVIATLLCAARGLSLHAFQSQALQNAESVCIKWLKCYNNNDD